MILWRITEDALGLFEGSCISDGRYEMIPWFNKALFEPVTEDARKEMIGHIDPEYCNENGVECLLFYNPAELDRFARKVYDIGIE